MLSRHSVSQIFTALVVTTPTQLIARDSVEVVSVQIFDDAEPVQNKKSA